MIKLEKAISLAAQHLLRPGTETLPLEKTMHRILAEDVLADRDVPPFHRSTMDGYACRREDLPGPLKVLETIEAGTLPGQAVDSGQCSKIMTGAMVPEGADCVVMKEYMEKEPDGSVLFTGNETDTHIDPRGQDLRQGELLLKRGTWITPGHMGIMASVGKIRVKVSRRIRVGILATGSELVDAGQQPEGAQIRNSNSYQLAALVEHAGHKALDIGMVEDNSGLIAERITTGLEKADLLLMTGGASVGELDLVPGVLKDLGLHLEFDRVAMQPGKPVSFAHGKGNACFGLSGNPVSSFVQFALLVRPYLELCSGATPPHRRIRMILEKGFQRKHADRQFFLPVLFTETGTCEPVSYHGSGHLHALSRATGFAEIPAGQLALEKGALVYVRLIK